jgi:hypothetical protein
MLFGKMFPDIPTIQKEITGFILGKQSSENNFRLGGTYRELTQEC